MTDVKRFLFEKESNTEEPFILRIEYYKHKLWFCARDICNMLGIARVGKIIAKLEGAVRTVEIEDDKGRVRDMAFIDLYALNHLLFRKDSDTSREIRVWFYTDVFPSLEE